MEIVDCVNMKTKTCVFGYGGIHVSVLMQRIECYSIKPPLGAGTKILDKDGNKIGDWEYTGNQLNVLFNTITEFKEMCSLLSEIETNKGGTFTFKGITFDFTKYEQESMNIVKQAMRFVELNFIRLMAC